jgi:HSP20 family protein
MNIISRRRTQVDPSTEFDQFLEHFFAPVRSYSELKSGLLTPHTDIVETDDQYEIKVDLPGIKKENINIHLEKGVLSIEAQTQSENTEEKAGQIIRQERRVGKYLRRFSLGENLAESDTTAQFTDGVLTLQIPKQKPQPAQLQKIAIQ